MRARFANKRSWVEGINLSGTVQNLLDAKRPGWTFKGVIAGHGDRKHIVIEKTPDIERLIVIVQ